MKQILLATVAAVAISFPAMAQSHKVPEPTKTAQMRHRLSRHTAKNMTEQPQKQLARNKAKETSGNNHMQAVQLINPMQLTRSQVREVQRTLDKKGFNARKVDGIWGPETAAALRRFQKHNDIDALGHLTRETLAMLGVNWARSHQQPDTVGYESQGMGKPNKASETTGSGASDNGISRPK